MLLDSGIELTTTRFQNLTSVIEINQFLSVKKKKKFSKQAVNGRKQNILIMNKLPEISKQEFDDFTSIL